MDRKKFIRNTLLGLSAAAATPTFLRARNVKVKESTYDKLFEQVGFNHLPTSSEVITNPHANMKMILHKADSRGHANHGWLDSHHSFSFANYYDPERIHFGALRVLNDDVVAPGRGFGTHPHDNMEIISIPLSGDLEHKDSMGNVAVIREGDVQVMSAGTGIYHSEYNRNNDAEVRFLQIWLFPREKQVTPRYDQISIRDVAQKNTFTQILSPSPDDQGVWIHQDAWFSIGDFDAGSIASYSIKKKGNGVYAFILEGNSQIEDQLLGRRDGLGIWDTDQFTFQAKEDSRILLMEVPMSIS
ncbi:MAG: pirin family protein [Saprospiraceae bacterium]|nr:pirin family protein [Saprospiraceae bacterium]